MPARRQATHGSAGILPASPQKGREHRNGVLQIVLVRRARSSSSNYEMEPVHGERGLCTFRVLSFSFATFVSFV